MLVRKSRNVPDEDFSFAVLEGHSIPTIVRPCFASLAAHRVKFRHGKDHSAPQGVAPR